MGVDKTDVLIERFKDIIEDEMGGGYMLSLNKLLGEIDYYLKIKAIKKCGNIASASILLGVKRTTLNEYLRKLGLTLKDVLNGNN